MRDQFRGPLRLLSLSPAMLLVAGCGDLSEATETASSVAKATNDTDATEDRADGGPISDPYLRADASFSRFPLERKTTPQAIGRLTNGEDCDDDMISCVWEDENGVGHIMGGDVIAIKIIDLDGQDNRPLTALGIGTARQRGAVLTNVRAFLPEVAIDCLSEDQAGEGDGLYSCSGSFEQGAWFKLIFDTNDYLVSARIDAFQMN